MKRMVSLFLIFTLGVLCMASCGANKNPWGDEIFGSYENAQGYTLVLRKGGRGSISHTSAYDTVTSEDLVFEFEKDGTLVLLGTAGGAVIGGDEFYGMPKKAEGDAMSYTLTLRSVSGGGSLSPFTKITK